MRYEVHKNYESLFIGNKRETADYLGFKNTSSIDNLAGPTRRRFLSVVDNPEDYLQVERIPPQYVVYKGDEFITIGTAVECSEFMGIKLRSFRFYMMPTYKNRVAERKNARNYITVTKIEEEKQ